MVLLTGGSLGYSYRDFCHDFGIPENLTFDGYSPQARRKNLFMKTIVKYDIQYHISSPHSTNENPAEGSMRELKNRWHLIIHKKNFRSDYGIMNWYGSVKLETYLYRGCVMKVLELLSNISPERCPT